MPYPWNSWPPVDIPRLCDRTYIVHTVFCKDMFCCMCFIKFCEKFIDKPHELPSTWRKIGHCQSGTGKDAGTWISSSRMPRIRLWRLIITFTMELFHQAHQGCPRNFPAKRCSPVFLCEYHSFSLTTPPPSTKSRKGKLTPEKVKGLLEPSSCSSINSAPSLNWVLDWCCHCLIISLLKIPQITLSTDHTYDTLQDWG